MKNCKFKLLTVFLFVVLNAQAQVDTLSLSRCIEIGLRNNLSLKRSGEDIRISQIAKSENRSKLLPIIMASASFTDNVNRGTSLSDGTNLGKVLGIDMPYMAGRGLQYTTNGGLQFSMPLYDQTIFAGINIADRMVEISRYSYEKAAEDLTMEIAKLYYLIQTTQEQIILIGSNIRMLEELRNITTALHDNDMALQIDVQRVEINLENLRVQLDNANSMCEQQRNLLRYTLDVDPDFPILVTRINGNDLLCESRLLVGVSSDLKELQLLNMQSELLLKKKESIKQSYLPTLSLVAGTSWTAYTDRFSNYFHSHPTNHWYNATFWGLQLKIPVFDGLARQHKIRTLNAEYARSCILIEDTENQLKTQYWNAVNDWRNNVRNLKRSSDNYKLAEDVYVVTTMQYKEGVTSMSTLLQDEMRMTEAQNSYVTTLYNFLLSELKLLKLTNQLETLSK